MSSGEHVIVDALPKRFPGDVRRGGCVRCGHSPELCARFPRCSGKETPCTAADGKTASRGRKRCRATRRGHR